METIKLLIKKILEHATDYEWELKGLGMMRTYLSEDTKLHVWDSRFKVPDVSLTHEHEIQSARLTELGAERAQEARECDKLPERKPNFKSGLVIDA